MKRPDPVGIGQIIEELKRSSNLGEQLEQAQIWERWPEIAGKTLSKQGRPKKIKKQQLVIEVKSAVAMHRFSYLKWTIIKRVNRMARRELISDLFFELMEEEAEEA